MAPSQYDLFLKEATINDHADSTLGRDCLYGLYTSWCFLQRLVPCTEDAFWTAMKKKRVHPGKQRAPHEGPGRG